MRVVLFGWRPMRHLANSRVAVEAECPIREPDAGPCGKIDQRRGRIRNALVLDGTSWSSSIVIRTGVSQHGRRSL